MVKTRQSSAQRVLKKVIADKQTTRDGRTFTRTRAAEDPNTQYKKGGSKPVDSLKRRREKAEEHIERLLSKPKGRKQRWDPADAEEQEAKWHMVERPNAYGKEKNLEGGERKEASNESQRIDHGNT